MCFSDEVIGQVLNIMKSQSVPYTAVYTALRPSRVSNIPKSLSDILKCAKLYISSFVQNDYSNSIYYTLKHRIHRDGIYTIRVVDSR